MNDSLMFIRMSTGEDLVSEVAQYKSDKEDTVLLINPLKIIYTFNARGNLSLSFYDWVIQGISTSQDFEVRRSDIITISKASEKIGRYYYEYFERMDGIVDKIVEEKTDPYDNMLNMDVNDEDLEKTKKLLDDIFSNKDGKRKLH